MFLSYYNYYKDFYNNIFTEGARVIAMRDDLNYKEIGKRIQKFRNKRGLTQDELGELIGSNQKYVSRLEIGNPKPYFSTIVAISRALQISVDSLIADYDNSFDESTLKLILDDIRGMNKKQLAMLRDNIATIKKLSE